MEACVNNVDALKEDEKLSENNFSMDEQQEKIRKVRLMAPAVLAYVGDAVYEVFVREYVAGKISGHLKALHKKSVLFVSAHAQSSILKALNDILTEEEADVVRRARNAKVTSMPKNADMMEYKYATAFEALIGFLHMSGQEERLQQLLDMVVKIVDNDEK